MDLSEMSCEMFLNGERGSTLLSPLSRSCRSKLMELKREECEEWCLVLEVCCCVER